MGLFIIISHRLTFMGKEFRPMSEMFESGRFSVPDNSDVWRERLKANGLYYFLNYAVLLAGSFMLSSITDRNFMGPCLLGIVSHASLRKRSVKSKFESFKDDLKFK